jgi:hypothetical protein
MPLADQQNIFVPDEIGLFRIPACAKSGQRVDSVGKVLAEVFLSGHAFHALYHTIAWND